MKNNYSVSAHITNNSQATWRRFTSLTRRSVLTGFVFAFSAPAISAKSGSVAVIEEIVVTSQKRSENIRDVPISVSAVDGETLRDFNIENMNDLSLITPNVKFNVTPTVTAILIRGLGTGENRGFEQSVGLIIDGVYYGRGAYLNGGLLDMERIEVLRGPQGTLFGKNTIAGALNISTGRPDPEFQGDVSALVGDYNQRRYTAVATGPVTNILSFRVAVSDDRKEGYIYNTTTGLNEADLSNPMGRAKLRLDVFDTLSVEYAIGDNEVVRKGSGNQLRAATDESLQVYRRADPETEADGSNLQTSKDVASTGGTRDIRTHTLTIDWDVGNFMVTSISGLSTMSETMVIDADFSALPLLLLDQDEDYRQASHELRLVSPPGNFEYVVGYYYFQSDLGGASIIESAPKGDGAIIASLTGLPPGLSPVFNAISGLAGGSALSDKSIKHYDQDTSAQAFFGQATWSVTDRWSIVFGYRYGRERKQMDQQLRFENSGLLFQQFLAEEPYHVRNRRSESDKSPKFSVKYDLTDNINFYATYAKGFKSGGFNPEAPRGDVVDFDAEQATTIELGSKMRLLGGAMTLNIGLFDTDFDNLQVGLFSGTSFYVGNAASVRTRGVELDSMLMLSENLVLTLSAGYTEAAYTSYTDGPCWSDGDDQAGPNPRERDDNGVCKQDLSGETLARAPDWNGALGIQYQFGVFDWPVRVVTGVNAMYQDDYFLSLDLDPIDSQEAYTQINAQLGFRSEDESWSLMFYGRNLTDEVVYLESGDLPLFGGDHFSARDLPRTYSAEFRLRWW